MNKKILISLFAITPLFAMQQQTTIFFKSNQVLYIGESSVRERLEEIYGTKFSMNTVFFPIGFTNAPKHELPQFIPYEMIKECGEDSTLTLELFKNKVAVICKQKDNPEYASHYSFHGALDFLAQEFCNRPNWLSGSEESLRKAGVIK